MHSARINQIRATPDFERLVTVSQDKTLRVWRARDLALMRVIAVPSEAGEEGALRALAITPDAREAIVGGWTGLAWSGGKRAQAYRFDLQTGRLLQVMRGFDGVIESMAISTDGRRLAIGLGGGAGLRVLDWPSGRELWVDREYAERVNFVDFAIDGTLATTSADGCLRVYSPEGSLSFRAEYPPREGSGTQCRGSELGGVRFSPDGKALAFGLQDRPEIVVFDPRQQQVQRRFTVEDPAQRSLCCPNWSADGTRLHMHGAFAGDGPTPLYRVTLASGAIERLPVGRQRFTNVLPLPNGELLVSTVAPSLARVGRDGQVLAEALPPNGDFRFAWNAWRLDANAETLLLPMDAAGGQRRMFRLAAPPETAFHEARSGEEAGLAPPDRSGGIQVDAQLDDFGYKQPVRVNGQPLRLKAFQSVRSWASDASRAALGTQWSVLVADARGRVLWEHDLPAPAYQVALSGNGRWVVAAVGDGTLRWYDVTSGSEAMGLFLHRNGSDWIAWRPDGSYASSPGGDEFLGWLRNRGDTREPEFLRAVQFERTLYRPDRVQAALREVLPTTTSRAVLEAAWTNLKAPEVRIEQLLPERREVRFSVRSGSAAVREVGVYADGIPVMPSLQRMQAKNADLQTLSVTIPSSLPFDRIRVEAVSDRAIGIDETASLRPLAAALTGSAKGRLWVLAIGVERFDDFARCKNTYDCGIRLPPLPNAPRDAAEVSAMLQERGRALFSEVRSAVVAHHNGVAPTKAAIMRALAALQAAAAEDTVLVFLASHGVADTAGREYYFVPADGSVRALEAVIGVQRPGAAPNLNSLLSATELSDALRRLAGRRLLIIDTCHAGAVGFSGNPYAINKRSASASFATLSAATGTELSYEHADPKIAHGGFTYALLRALRGELGPQPSTHAMTLQTAFEQLLPEVKRNMDAINAEERRRKPVHVDFKQTPNLVASPVLRETALTYAP
ncbi:hypothetical protein ASD35_20220 [Pelomonas sp. Root1444]|nr:hypothetical protein ASD35_20220 [Pelomonas sp. Root1444]